MTQLVAFLNSGRPVYAEGGDLGFSNNTSELWPYFGTSYLGDGNSTGNVQSLTGEPSTFAEGMSFEYPYQQGPDSWVDEFGSAGGTVVLRSQDRIGRTVCYEASTYRTIASSTIFGASSEAKSDALMSAYMDYLVLGTGITERTAPTAQATGTVTPSVVRVGAAIRFATSGPARSLTVLDVCGRSVASWQVPAGSAVTTWNIGSSIAPGAYFMRVRSSASSSTQSFAVVR
jgi:hypothetical protein